MLRNYVLLATLFSCVMSISERIEASDVVDVKNEGMEMLLKKDEIFAKYRIMSITDKKKPYREVTIEVERDRGPYLLGEPIYVRYHVMNETSETVTLPWNFVQEKGAVDFRIHSSEGREIDFLSHREAVYGGPGAVAVPSDMKIVNVIDLRYWYAIVEPGSYSVVAEYTSKGGYYEMDPPGEWTWHPAWEGKLSVDLGEFEVVAPSESVDIEALDRLKVPLRGSERKYRYALMFDVAQRENPDFIDEYPTSRYAAYLLFEMAERAMLRDQWRTPERAERALDLLKRIDRDDYPGLFQELVYHRLIVAHVGAGSDREVIASVVTEFREKFPQSPYKLPEEAFAVDE